MNIEKFRGILLALITIILLANFQPKPIEYQIVSGYIQYWPNEVSTYYLWDGTRSINCSDQYELLGFMQRQGFELVSTHSCSAGNSGGYPRYKETWIFKK